MLLFQILSDLHLESPKQYELFDITPKAPYLALLGDIGNAGALSHRSEMLDFFRRQLRAFRAVLFVPGNHEAYNSTWPETLAVLRGFEAQVASQRERDPSTLGQFLPSSVEPESERESPKSDEEGSVLVLGCSLFSHVPSDRMAAVEMGLNDFHQIGDGWDVPDHNAAHARDLAWLNEQVRIADEDPGVTSIVILTHWSPLLG